MTVPVIHVDAFTDVPFAGNPAAVCLLPSPGAEAFMQHVAAEMNLPATAFVTRRGDGFDLRWFSPTVELTLCGHGTLAAAHVLWERGVVGRSDVLSFATRSGGLTAQQNGAFIELDLPLEREAPAEPPADLLRALGVASPKYVGRNRLDYLVEVDGEATVRRIRPDLALLRSVPTRGVIVTGPSASPAYDFVSRFFAPSAGIDEDWVTGSAHCCLAAFWSARLGRDGLRGYQASARGGVVTTRVRGDRALLGGQAVTILHATLLTP